MATVKPCGVLVSVQHGIPGDPESITVEGETDGRTIERAGADRFTLRDRVAGTAHRVLVLPGAALTGPSPSGVDRREVVIDGWRVQVGIEPAARAALRDRATRGRAHVGQSGPTNVHAIIPGVVVSVSVAPGDAVAAGQQLLVVEAMKMQNELRAPRDGTIEQVAVGAGATIDVGDLLVVLA